MLKIAFLAFLQGVAEFLPISSSGHLVISQHFLGINIDGVRLDVCLHAGTLISIFVFYRKTICRLFLRCFSPRAAGAERREAWSFVLKIFLSTAPAVLIYFLFSLIYPFLHLVYFLYLDFLHKVGQELRAMLAYVESVSRFLHQHEENLCDST
mgnify:CR=1 FL=1